MPTYDVHNIENKPVGKIELDPGLFEVEIKEHLLYYVVNWQLARRRAGTASTKTRAEVSGSGRKPWKQKGSGNARAGSKRSPLWRGGGVAFGPKPRDWSYGLPKKVRRGALLSALSLKHRDGKISVLDSLELPEIKTKLVKGFLDTFGLEKVLIVIDGDNTNFKRSARNIQGVKVLRSEGINVYDLLKFDTLVLTEGAAKQLQEALLH